MDLCIPHSILPSRQSFPWLTKTLVNTTKKRNHLENQCEVEIYRPSQSTKACETLLLRPFGRSNKPFLQACNPPACAFWRTLKRINNSKTTINIHLRFQTIATPVAIANVEKANCLNKHFSGCFNTVLLQLSQSEFLHLDPNQCPSQLLCSESEVLISTLKYELLRKKFSHTVVCVQRFWLHST